MRTHTDQGRQLGLAETACAITATPDEKGNQKRLRSCSLQEMVMAADRQHSRPSISRRRVRICRSVADGLTAARATSGGVIIKTEDAVPTLGSLYTAFTAHSASVSL